MFGRLTLPTLATKVYLPSYKRLCLCEQQKDMFE